jgi:predicted DNA-binding transcriptional regulator YafY
MADHLKFERYYWFDRQVRRGVFPNAATLARRFEISAKTAQRTIDYMRDKLAAPLEYDGHRKGYFYTVSGFTLRPFEVSQNELLAVLLAQNLLSGSAGGVISRSIRSFGRKLFAATGAMGLSEERIGEAFSAVWHGFAPAEAETFRTVADALVQRQRLAFHYFAPSTNERTERLVEPHHLQHYMGGWVLLARCLERDGWRKFHLGRMREVRLAAQPFTPRPPSEWQGELSGAFGIFQGGAPVRVVLRFNSFRARWVRDELWHAEQRVEELPDGALLLSFPVADFREVKLRILQFGADVEVVEPLELRREVAQEIGRMGELYRGG